MANNSLPVLGELRIDDLHNLRSAGVTNLVVYFDATHRSLEKKPHLDVNFRIDVSSLARLKARHMRTFYKFNLHLQPPNMSQTLKYEAFVWHEYLIRRLPAHVQREIQLAYVEVLGGGKAGKMIPLPF